MSKSSITTGVLADYRFDSKPSRPQMILARKRKKPYKRKPPYRFVLVNFKEARVGDRIIVKPCDGLDIKIAGPVAVIPTQPGGPTFLSDDPAQRDATQPRTTTSGASTDPIPSRNTQHLVYILYLHKPGTLRVSVKGKPRTKIKIPIVYPELPANPLETQRLLGPLQGQMPHYGKDILSPLDRWFEGVDLIAGSQCNYFSACPISTWNQERDFGSPFPVAASFRAPFLPAGGINSAPTNRRYNLSKIDPLYRKALTAMFWRAARAGVVIDWYLFDHVSLTHGWMWDANPLNARNNIHGWISDKDCAHGRHDPKHALYAVYDKGCQPALTKDLVRTMAHNLANLIPPALRDRHRVGAGIETESRTFDWWLLHKLLKPLDFITISNLKSWYHDQNWHNGLLPDLLDTDLRWMQLAESSDIVCAHGCDSNGDTAHRLDRLVDPSGEFGFQLMASTDGTKRGPGPSDRRRPEGNRPSVDDLVAVWNEALDAAGDKFNGLEIKVLSPEDARSVLPAVASRIDLNK